VPLQHGGASLAAQSRPGTGQKASAKGPISKLRRAGGPIGTGAVPVFAGIPIAKGMENDLKGVKAHREGGERIWHPPPNPSKGD